MIHFDEPFIPDEPGDRLLSDGRRDMAGLIVPLADGEYEVNF